MSVAPSPQRPSSASLAFAWVEAGRLLRSWGRGAGGLRRARVTAVVGVERAEPGEGGGTALAALARAFC